MSLIAGNNAVYSFLQQRTIFQLYGISLACIIFFVSAGFFLMYLPLQNSIDISYARIAQMQDQLKTLNRSKQSSVRLQQSISQLHKSLKGYIQNRPLNLVLHDAVIFLTECAIAQKLTIGACRLCTAEDKTWCKLNQITTEFSGTMEQIAAFFEKVNKSNRLIACKKFELVKRNETTFSLAAVFQLLIVV